MIDRSPVPTRGCRRGAVCRLLALVLALAPVLPQLAPAQAPAPAKELIAVLDIEAVDASPAQASALTDRLREELLKTGRYTMVDRSQMNAILEEQALQQTSCTTEDCAAQAGRILGVKKIVVGRITRLGEESWLLSGMTVDVETAETLRVESVQHEGEFNTLLGSGIAVLAAKLSGVTPPLETVVEGAPEPLPGAAAPEAQIEAAESGWPWWAWALIGVGVLGLAAAAAGQEEDKSTTTTDPCPTGAGTCGTISGTW